MQIKTIDLHFKHFCRNDGKMSLHGVSLVTNLPCCINAERSIIFIDHVCPNDLLEFYGENSPSDHPVRSKRCLVKRLILVSSASVRVGYNTLLDNGQVHRPNH